MPGLEIKICVWQLDSSVVDEVKSTLTNGGIEAVVYPCKDLSELLSKLDSENPDLILAPFSGKRKFHTLPEIHPILKEFPLVYLYEDTSWKAEYMEELVWDYVPLSQMYRLIPAVTSSVRLTRIIGQQIETEHNLVVSRERYRSIFESVSDAVLLLGVPGMEVTEYNPKVLELFGLQKEDMNNLDFAKYSCTEEGYTIELAREYIKKAKEKSPFSFEWRNRDSNGRVFWTLNSFSMVEIGGKSHVLLVSRDVDEQKRLEQSLVESQEHFRALAENSPDVIMRFDRDHRHVYINHAAGNTGIAKEDFMGKSHREMDMFPGELVKKWEDAMDQVFTEGKPHTIVFDLELNERSFSYEWILYPEIGRSEAVEYVFGVARDVTESMKAGSALKRSEERLNLALQATGLGLWDWNLKTDEVYYSPIWMSMLGYGPDELPQVLDTWTSLQHPDDSEKSYDTVMRVIKNREQSFEIEFRLMHKSGNYIWVRSMGRAVEFDEEGNTTRLTGIHEDIHRRKRDQMVRQVLFDISNAVGSTRSLEELYHKIRDSLGHVVDTTNCFLALYNEKSDTLSLPFMEDEKDSFTEFPARKTLTTYVIRTGIPQLVDVERERNLISAGEIEEVGSPCISWLGVPLKHDGKTIGVFAVQSYSENVVYNESDASLLEFASDQIAMAIERKRQQDDIRSTQERQRRVFESSPDPMIVADRNALITDFNGAFLEVFDVDPDIARGQKLFGFIKRPFWRQAMKDFNETWSKGFLKNMEYVVVGAGGLEFEAEVSSGAIYSGNGEPDSMVLIVKNISERKDAERKILEAKYKAEESDRLKTAFLSNMSHEIRTPMNAIVGFSDLLSEDGLSSEDRREFIAQINQGADDLMRLIDDIIDIAKIEAGQVNIHISECFIRDLFKELHLMFLQNLKRSGKEQVTMELKWDWPLSDLVIYTDPFRLKQILVNLLGNAVKFTEKGEIVLGIAEDPQGVKIYVKDSGIGIREEKQELIFDRFMQGHETKTKLYGGTGLGLAISKNLTEILGGNIGVSSVSGEGSTFWFILPRNEVPLKYEAAIKTPTSDLRTWDDKKILIAEDDHSNYYFLFEAIKDTGVSVLWSKDGEETLAMFRENEDLNLILMDINMPYINGYDCTRIIKEERPQLPVIAQTAYAMSGEREFSKDAGCDDYLSKPIKVKELLETLAKFL